MKTIKILRIWKILCKLEDQLHNNVYENYALERVDLLDGYLNIIMKIENLFKKGLFKRINVHVRCRGQWWRSGTKCDCKIDWLWVRSPFEVMKYLFTFIFSFLRFGVEAKRGVVFRHSTRKQK